MEQIKFLKPGKRDVLNSRTGAEKVLFAIFFVILVIYSLTMLYPFFWMIISSLKGATEYAVGNPLALPERWRFENYANVFQNLSLPDGTTYLDMVFNSLWYTLLSSGLTCFMSCVTGYCISKYRFKGRNFIYGTAIFCMTIPIVGTTGAYYRLIGQLHLYDTPLYVVVTHMSSWGTYFLIMYGFFKNVSWSYAEAVFIDGGGHYTVFFKIMLPQALGPIATLFIMSFIGNWNDYMSVIMYLPSYQTLASGLYTYRAVQTRSVNFPEYFAGLLVSMLPIIVLFSLFSDVIMKNMSVGGLKG